MPVFDEVRTEAESEDHELVLRYSAGRKVSDPSLPYEIGIHFLKGDEGFFQSTDFAEKWLLKSADMDFAPAMLALAELYLTDTKKNGYRRPALLLKKAAQKGSEAARLHLDMSKVSDPRTRDAFVTYRLNAELGNAEACRMLGEGFEKEYYGKGQWEAAVRWYARAYSRGDSPSGKRAVCLAEKKNVLLGGKEQKLLEGCLR